MITQYHLWKTFIFTLCIAVTVPIKLLSQNIVADVITKNKASLYYPQSVSRFYEKNDYKLIWIAPDTVKTHTSDAMLLLDCVVQYGLAHQDYHAAQLQYDALRRLIVEPANTDNYRKALYDIYLTDALICFINNLHYGRLNPEWTSIKIDSNFKLAFQAGAILRNALTQPQFKSAIIGVQPKSKAYQALQYQMYTVTGLHTGDFYQTPESEIRLMAINMERLRWINETRGNIIEINIPSHIISLYKDDNIYRFKTSGLLSQRLPATLSGFAIERGNVIFNKPDISFAPLHEIALQSVNNKQISIPHGNKLAALLLNHHGQMNETGSYKLPVPLPLKFTYYTCEMLQGVIVKYKDVYRLDKKMEADLIK